MRRLRAGLGQQRTLAIFAVASLSMVAYLPEELVHYLGPKLNHSSPAVVLISTLAVSLLLMVALVAYRQMTAVYPQSRDAYSIARGTLGRLPRLMAGGGLLASYVLAIAVSVSAGVSALVTLWPTLALYQDTIATGIILLSCLLYVRGRRVPTLTYALAGLLFSCIWLLTLALAVKHVQHVARLLVIGHLPPEAIFLLSAIGVGSAMIVGSSTVLHGRMAGRQRITVLFAAAFGSVLLLLDGTIWLAAYWDLARQSEPVLSYLARSVYSASLGWYLMQGATVIILLAAAQTPFAGVTHIITLIARDGDLPQQFALRNDRRSRADGAIIFTLCVTALVLCVHASVTRLFPWYVVTTCSTFMVAQVGMALRCARLKLTGWRRNLLLHGITVVAACIMLVLIGSMTLIRLTEQFPL